MCYRLQADGTYSTEDSTISMVRQKLSATSFTVSLQYGRLCVICELFVNLQYSYWWPWSCHDLQVSLAARQPSRLHHFIDSRRQRAADIYRSSSALAADSCTGEPHPRLMQIPRSSPSCLEQSEVPSTTTSDNNSSMDDLTSSTVGRLPGEIVCISLSVEL